MADDLYLFARHHTGEWRGRSFEFKTRYKESSPMFAGECEAWASVRLGRPVRADELKIDGRPLRW